MSNKEIGMDCTGRQCGFRVFAGDMGCTDGASCFAAGLLEAQESKFHDATLAEATSKINSVLSAIPADPSGRQLSFLQTKMGTMLAWVRHDVNVPEDAIKAIDSNVDVAKALGIIDPPQREDEDC